MKPLSFLLAGHHAIVPVVIGALSLVTAVGAFASQDMLPAQSEDNSMVSQEVTETPTSEPTSTPVDAEPSATPTPADSEEGTATPTPEDVSDATPTATPEADDGDETGPRDIAGIPDSNPVKSPEDGDGECEKGETVVKTNPSGKRVTVPCQAVKTHEPESEENDQSD